MVDIFQFAGLAYAFCTLLKHYAPQPFMWLILAGLIICISPFLWHEADNQSIGDYITAVMYGGKKQGAVFPIFPWLTFPLLGMCYGYWFKNTKNLVSFHRKSMFIGFTAIILGQLYNQQFNDPTHGEYAHLEPGSLFWMTGFILLWINTCRWIVTTIPHNAFLKQIFFWSRNVTTIYVIQWLIIGWGLMIVGSQQLNITSTLLAIIVVLLLTEAMTRVWLTVKKPSTQTFKTEKFDA